MGRMTASSVLVGFLVATVAALPSTLLEDTKQAATESEPIISKGKEQIIYLAASLKIYGFYVSSTNPIYNAEFKTYVLLKIRI